MWIASVEITSQSSHYHALFYYYGYPCVCISLISIWRHTLVYGLDYDRFHFLYFLLHFYYYFSGVCYFTISVSWARYFVWDTHLVHGIPIPTVYTRYTLADINLINPEESSFGPWLEILVLLVNVL